MNRHKKPESFIRTPSYPGGNAMMDRFVKENMVYPEEAIRNKIAGKVSLAADIDYKGNVTKVQVKKGIGFGCDEEAARIVSLMKFESLRYRGLHVVYHKTLHIHFHLPGVAPVNPEITYSYKENKNSGKPGNGTYEYTLIPGE